jgi:hypothetical protein
VGCWLPVSSVDTLPEAAKQYVTSATKLFANNHGGHRTGQTPAAKANRRSGGCAQPSCRHPPQHLQS